MSIELNQVNILFLKKRKPLSCREHEWSKHGTCATSLPATSNELKYFGMGLKLHAKYNISR